MAIAEITSAYNENLKNVISELKYESDLGGGQKFVKSELFCKKLAEIDEESTFAIFSSNRSEF